ncbi:MAG TPA: HAD-IIIC family phosphatase [Bryobacteraceae bacterium]|nr:HAD-IIIC family phosphatase [Bryobacteraceae bacterium]
MTGSVEDVVAAVRRAASELGPPELQTMRDLAELAVAGGQFTAALAALEGETSAAAAWTRAALLEANGDTGGALAALEIMPELAWGDSRSRRWLAITRLRAKQSQPEAALSLREAVRSAASYRTLRQADAALRDLNRRKLDLGPLRRYHIAVLSTVNADFLPEILRPLLFAAGVDAEFWTAPFDQVQQTLFRGSADLTAFRPDLVMLAMDWRAVDPAIAAETHVEELRQLWRICQEQFGAAVIQFNYEIPAVDPMGRLSRLLPGGRRRLLEAINAALWEAEAQQAGAVIFDVEQLAGEFGKARWHDSVAWEISRQYPSAAALPVLGRRITALVRAVLGMTSKCLALDLDGVLWGGVIGEDGLNGVRVGGTGSGAAHAAFQAYCKGLKARGVLLAVCSKNNSEDALLPFREHPEMILHEDDIAVFAANWQSKEENLRSIAAQINIGLDSLVFIDDNPAERERIRQMLPMVETPEMPSDPSGFAAALDATGLFEALRVTGEDLLRTASIRADAQRGALVAAHTDPTAYLHGLEMTLQAQPFNEQNLPRIVQLFNKTNQFNLTTRRITEADVRTWMGRHDAFLLSVRLADRLGDFGLTGLLVAFEQERCLRIDSWLMSCRILGRGVEQALLALTLDEGRRRGCSDLTGEYIPTPKNKQVADIYPRFGFVATGEGRYRLAVADARIEVPPYLRLVVTA